MKDDLLVPTSPPMEAVQDILALPELPFPVLRSVSAIPLFAANASLTIRHGYDAATESFCALDGTALPSIPNSPTSGDVAAARKLILEDLLGDFCFAEQASRAAAVAALLVRPVRALIDGPTPLLLIESSTPGAGKTLLAEIIHTVATGRPAEVEPEGEARAEWRKRITARLLRAPSLVLFDNVSGRLDSPALAAALTAVVWSDRLLGSSRQVVVPVDCCWLATGNNAELSEELSRRTVAIRIDPGCDQPYLRKDFRHPDLLGWAKATRPRLVWAALVLCRVWIAQGAPSGAKILGRFESWSRVMGGILEVAGIPGLLTDRKNFDSRVNVERREWIAFVERWWYRFGDRPVGTSELLLLARGGEVLEGVLGGRSGHAQKYALGKELDRRTDRVLGEFRIVRETNDFKGRKQYRLHRVFPGSDGRKWAQPDI
jgi:hypothetical protein